MQQLLRRLLGPLALLLLATACMSTAEVALPTPAATVTAVPSPTAEPTAAPEATATPQPTATPEATATPEPTAAPEPDWEALAYPVAGCGATFDQIEEPTFSVIGGATTSGPDTLIRVTGVTRTDIDGDGTNEVFIELECFGTAINSARWEIVLVFEDVGAWVVRDQFVGQSATLRYEEIDGTPTIDVWSQRRGDSYHHSRSTFDETGQVERAATSVSAREVVEELGDARPLLEADAIAGVRFGTDQITALDALVEAFGPPTGSTERIKCGGAPGGPLEHINWHGELTVLFVGGELQGWAYSTTQFGLSPDWHTLNDYDLPVEPTDAPKLWLETTDGIGLFTLAEDLGARGLEETAYDGTLDIGAIPWVALWELEAESGGSIVGILDRTGGRTVGLSSGYLCGERWHPLPP